MDQNSLKLARLGQETGIEQNDPTGNVRGRQMRPQGLAEFHPDGTAGQRRQHSTHAYRFGGAALGGRVFGDITPGNPAGTAGVGALKKS